MDDAPVPPFLSISLDKAVFALAGALDLVGIDEIAHGRRVASIALACAERLGWDTARRDELLHTALLHDCGVSTTTVHRKLVEKGVEEPGPEALEHCTVGAASFAALPRLAPLAPVIRHHHTPWPALSELEPAQAALANLIFLADRVDVLRYAEPGEHARALRERILRALETRRSSWFNPDFLDVLAEASRPEAFWYGLDDRFVDEALCEHRPEANGAPLSLDDLRGLARIFARIVDLKSRFTLQHSEGVSKLARRLGEEAGWTPEECAALEIAGFFHDIGKLRVPDTLLEKPGPLDLDERETIKRHAYDTWRILRRMFPGSRVAEWAAYHHEWVAGGGYPFGLKDGDLDAGARFVAVADVTQALLQRRPYRNGLGREEVIRRLRNLAGLGQLDGTAVDSIDRVLHGGSAS